MHTLERNPITVNKKFMEYFFPTVLTAMANNIALIVDSIVVGNLLGSSALAAVNLLSPVIQLYFAITLMFGLGAATLISIAKGEQNKKSAERTFTVATTVMIALSLVLIAVQLIFLNPIVNILSPDETLRSLVKQYYVPYIIGTPFTMLVTGLSHCIRIDGRPKLASNALIIANAVNLCLDFVFISACDMGIKGASLATVTGNFVGLVIILTHFFHKENTLHFEKDAFGSVKIFGREITALLGVGLSGALGALLITVRMAFLNTYVQQLGDVGSSGVVALSVNSSCQVLISTFITGASQTMIPILGVMLGQKDFAGVKMTLKKTWSILLIANAAILLVLELFAKQAAMIFGVTNTDELEIVIPSIRITTLSFIGLSASFMFLYYFMATKQKAISTMISVVNGVVLIIPLSIVLGELFGITGIWWAFVATQIGTLIAIWIAVSIKKKKSNGQYNNFYLLPEAPTSEIASVSFSGTKEEASNAAKYILQFMKKNNISDNVAMKIAIAVEEMAVTAVAKKGAADIDLRISVDLDDIVLSVRDNGIPFKYTDDKREMWQDIDVSSVGVLKALAKNIEYTNVLGFNQTTITVDNKPIDC